MAQRRAPMKQSEDTPAAASGAAAAAAAAVGDSKAGGGGGLRLIVVGSTGAVGSACVRDAASRPEVSAVTAVVRRAGAFQLPADTPAAARAKVTERVLDFSALKAADFAGHDGVFLCLGANFAAGDIAAQMELVKALAQSAAKAARDAGVKHVSFVSGAAIKEDRCIAALRKSYAAEQSFAAMGFESAAIFRPGIFDAERGAQARGLERCMVCCASYVCCACFWCCCPRFTPIKMSHIASAMVSAFVSPHKQPLMLFDGSNGIERAVASFKAAVHVAPPAPDMKR